VLYANAMPSDLYQLKAFRHPHGSYSIVSSYLLRALDPIPCLASHVQTGRRTNVPLDEFLARLHLREQGGITNNSCRILGLTTSFIQARDNSDDGSFKYVRHLGNAGEGHTASPFVDDLDKAEIFTMVSIPFSRAGVRFGAESVRSWNTKQDRSATISSGS
jgi:hypothetical protein